MWIFIDSAKIPIEQAAHKYHIQIQFGQTIGCPKENVKYPSEIRVPAVPFSTNEVFGEGDKDTHNSKCH